MADPGNGNLLRTLARIVTEGGPTGPQRIGEACLVDLPVSRGAITVMAGANRQQPVWVSDDVAGQLDQLQFSLGEGPCVEAFTEGTPVLVPDLAEVAGHRWPMFAAAARRTPVRALYVLPLQIGAIAVGVLDLYRDEPGMLTTTELAGALRAADAALWTLLGLRAGSTAVEGAPGGADRWLDGSPLRHTEVYQATGMVMAQIGTDPENALSRMRAYAFVHDRAIDEVARDVVARRLRFDEEEQR